MFNPPRTLEEAEKTRYGDHPLEQFMRRPHTFPVPDFQPNRCAYAIHSMVQRFDFIDTRDDTQCSRKPGHGPNGLYCKQHVKMVEE